MGDHRHPGDTARKGYGGEHQRLRAAWKSAVAAGEVDCVRCGQRIGRGQPWDLGHVDGSDKRVYSGPEHRTCNRRAGASAMAVRDPTPRVRQWWREDDDAAV